MKKTYIFYVIHINMKGQKNVNHIQCETDLSFRLSMLKNIKNNFVVFISTFGMV